MPAASTCINSRCRTVVEGTVAKCPNCGGRMITPRGVRIAGGVLLACGVLLAGAMGWLYYALSPTMLHPGTRIGSTTFNGTAEQARVILSLFGTIAAFGAASMFYGLWMLFTGRRNIAIMLLVLALAVAIGAMCWWTLQVLPA